MESNLITRYKFECGWNKNIDFKTESEMLLKVLNSAEKENDIQKYIKENKKWFIPASLFGDYDFGHHEAFLVPEQSLGKEYKVDYMLVGKNSVGYNIVLVEFENVNVDYKNKFKNGETIYVRNGLVQIQDWKRWMDNNREYFMRSCGLSDISNNIPTWGIRYCLVVSRREKIDKTANDMRRQTEVMNGIHIVTYDRLVDNVARLTNGF